MGIGVCDSAGEGGLCDGTGGRELLCAVGAGGVCVSAGYPVCVGVVTVGGVYVGVVTAGGMNVGVVTAGGVYVGVVTAGGVNVGVVTAGGGVRVGVIPAGGVVCVGAGDGVCAGLREIFLGAGGLSAALVFLERPICASMS